MTIAIGIAALLIIFTLSFFLLKAREENARLKEQNRLVTEAQQRLKEDSKLVFRAVASQLLSEQGRNLKMTHEERLDEILDPFKSNMEKLQRSIDSYRTQQVGYAAALQQQIKDLSDVNRNIGKEAQELTHALRGDSKVQGDWGEMILERILDASGLKEGINYHRQATHNDDGTPLENEHGKRLRPDVIFKLPDGKQVIVDSKVSLTAYSNHLNAGNEPLRTKALQHHIASVKSHIDELAGKDYQRWVENSADFVIMFIPNEPAYLLAMSKDDNLWEYAFKKQVIIVSPTHLIAVIKLINQLWSRERQTKNALKIADEAGKMYNKFADFVNDLQNASKAIENAQKAYDNAWKKLSEGNGNLMSRARKIEDLGAKSSKKLPENEV